MEYDIVEYSNGNKYYYKKGTKILHREDGPAIEHIKWYKAWYINGKLHRTDGPAIEYFDGDKEWFINGEILSPEKQTILNKCFNKRSEK
jgi:hypothetical protein